MWGSAKAFLGRGSGGVGNLHTTPYFFSGGERLFLRVSCLRDDVIKLILPRGNRAAQ